MHFVIQNQNLLVNQLLQHIKKYKRYKYIYPHHNSKIQPYSYHNFQIKINNTIYNCSIQSNTTIKATLQFLTYIQNYNNLNNIFQIQTQKTKIKLKPYFKHIPNLHITINNLTLPTLITLQKISKQTPKEALCA